MRGGRVVPGVFAAIKRWATGSTSTLDRFAERHQPNLRGLFFTFRGVDLKCGCNGCSIVVERQTGKLDSKSYVYFHFTESRRKCEKTWYRREDLEKKFADEMGK